jgi:hypothetical protein
MILSQERWMNLRAFKALADAGASWAEIARETGYDWRTVKRYLSADAPATPPTLARRGPGPRMIDPYAHLVDAWLRAQPKLKASVIWERLVAEHGFTGHYQRVKVYIRENWARLAASEPEPAGFHRRFEVLAGAQAQVDWGDEGELPPSLPALPRAPIPAGIRTGRRTSVDTLPTMPTPDRPCQSGRPPSPDDRTRRSRSKVVPGRGPSPRWGWSAWASRSGRSPRTGRSPHGSARRQPTCRRILIPGPLKAAWISPT